MMTEEWNKIAADISQTLPKAHFLTYFRNTNILRYEEGILTVGLPREFFRGWCEEHGRQPILSAAAKVWPECKDVTFEVDGSLEQGASFDPRSVLSVEEESPKMRKLPKRPEMKISRAGTQFVSRMLNPSYTLGNYIVGENNALAHAASTAAAREPGKKYNPLFIYGGVGLGKTHLLQAIGSEIMKNNPNAMVIFYPTQNFVDEVVTAVRSGKADKIREKFRRADVFILDDVQFLAGKERTQEILFHTFNDLFDGEKQIVFSADRSPSELDKLEDRLVSRFSMGMVVDVQNPDFETRLAILQEKMSEAGVIFDPKVLEFVAEQVPGSIRELTGILKQMVANYELQEVMPNRTNVMEILKKRNKDLRDDFDMEEIQASGRVMSLQDIAERTALYFDVPLEKMKSSTRLREYTVPRQVAMWFAHKRLRLPLQQIGNYFGGRDHTSVLSAVRRTEKNRKLSTEFWRQTNELRKQLGL